MTREEAIILAKSAWWKTKTASEIVGFQLFEERLCCPFSEFHKAMEEVFGRPIFTHEFVDMESMVSQYKAISDN